MERLWTGVIAPQGYQPSPEPMLHLDEQDRVTQLAALKVFDDSPDLARIWEFNRERGQLQVPAPTRRHHRVHGTAIHLVWPFADGRLILHSPQILKRGVASVGVLSGVLFDSCLYNDLYNFVENRTAMTSEDAAAIARLLDFLIASKYDYQALPYIFEQYANGKNDLSRAREYAFKMSKCILKLHTMDEEIFRATRKITPDTLRLEDYEEEYGTNDYDLLTARMIGRTSSELQEEPPMIRFTLMCLMKLAIIRRVTHARNGVNKQSEAFDDFLLNRVGFVAAYVRILAVFYFSGRADRLISAQLGCNVDLQISLLANTAWDFYLGMMPELILAQSEEPIAEAYFFCTKESQLAEALVASAVKLCIVMKDGSFKLARELDEDLLASLLGTSFDKYLIDSIYRLNQHSRNRTEETTTPANESLLTSLYCEVEADFRSHFGRSIG